MSTTPVFVLPPAGGNYIRNPDTGALTLVPDLPRVAVDAAPVEELSTPPKKGSAK